jgi:sec-independent protein translocase protein TatC
LKFRRRRDPAATMTVVEHLEELRHRLVVSILAIGAGAIGGWFLYPGVFNVLTNAFCDFMVQHPDLASDAEDPCKLVYLSVTEPFLMKIKLVAFVGLVLALPVVLYQFWRFVTPGLLPRERRYAAPFILVSLALFALGGWFALITLPKGLDFLLGFAGTDRLVPILSIAKYIGFVILLILAFGVAFEFPVILVSLTLVGVLSSAQLRQWRRYALLVIAVAAAVITPSQDFFTMGAMMVPLLIFYELSILISRILKR